MAYQIKGTLYGFENTSNVEIKEIDELFSTMVDVNDENISFTLIRPNLLREYAFDLPADVKALLEINENSTVSVYNILIIQKPLEKSIINFLAPIVINLDNNYLAQAILDPKKYPDYGMAESIESFKN
ncbi:flagellar assembly protein FliW [Sulfurimonas sp. C5]|uniref:flagellar assembly protein FliW n=1 Tax=Sulfurimonas sp. C5 TaxID=3036947 RepID=UPI00245407DB|nr:flagellar assembly protein FliW [Sulfurimonas sp. C5]MDH4944883.1 flagellar assembly protein FliW [Sulfurimonas sp. C5]